MAKKGQAVQLQTDVNTDEEWEKLMQRSALILVDVYSEWCGPCSSMCATLKKIKVETGGDNLALAIAKSDGITVLERFRTKSEPTWMFIIEGKMVHLVFGADAPKLTQEILIQLKVYLSYKASGNLPATAREVTELSEEESERYALVKAVLDEKTRIETEKREQAIYDRRFEVTNHVNESFKKNGIILVFPIIKLQVKDALKDLWEPAGLVISATERPNISEEMLEELLYFSQQEFSEPDLHNLLNNEALAYLIKPTEGDLFTEDIDEAVLRFIYGEMMCPPGSEDSPAFNLISQVPVPKEVPEEARKSTASDGIPSLSEFKLPSKSKSIGFSSIEITSKTQVGSKIGSIGSKGLKSEQSLQETIPITGLWSPPNALTKGLAIKLLFPRAYEPIALPEPIPIPPYIAITFDTFKRKEVYELMEEYPEEIMRYGFFTTDSPDTAQLICKTKDKFEQQRIGGVQAGSLVIQLSRKTSEAQCAFSQLAPTFMSYNTVEGEEECKIFFPEGYDEVEEIVEEVVEDTKKKKKKGKKGKPKEKAEGEEEEVEEEAEVEGEEEVVEEEGEGEGEGEEEDEGDGTISFVESKAEEAKVDEVKVEEVKVEEVKAEEVKVEEVKVEEVKEEPKEDLDKATSPIPEETA